MSVAKSMMKRTTFTSITPLPLSISRETAIGFLHDHLEMIDLNPLIKKRFRISVPEHASADEKHCIWYSLTDEIVYIPGMKAASSDISYTCAFHDLPVGLQTHCYAPMGVDIRDRWSIGGSLPGEAPEPRELGLDIPAQGLYLREDVDLRCNILMTSFVKKTLQKSHGALVEKLKEKAVAMSKHGTPRSHSTDPPRRTSAAVSSINHPSSESSSPHFTPRYSVSGHVDDFKLPSDPQAGQVPWQSLTTKQQQQRQREYQLREKQQRDSSRGRSHSHLSVSSSGSRHDSHLELPSAQQSVSAISHDSHHELPSSQLPAPTITYAAPVELDAPVYPSHNSYSDISSKTPFDEKTPDTPSDHNKALFEANSQSNLVAPMQQRHPTVLRPTEHHRRTASATSQEGPFVDPGQQRHPTVLKPGGYAVARKPVKAAELE